MYRKLLPAEVGSISKKIKKDFSDVVLSMEIQLRQKSKSKLDRLQKLQAQVKHMSRKINTFSNLLLNDNFSFRHIEEEPLIMVKYCDIIMETLIDNYTSDTSQLKLSQSQKPYNQNNIYEAAAALKLQNYDLKQKILSLNKKLQISNERAISSQQIAQNVKQRSQIMINEYKQNFVVICDLLKKTQNNQIELVQNNRLLKQEIQSLSIQFQRYKQNFKQGPSIKQKQAKIKQKLERQYEQKLKNIVKQIQYGMKSQIDRKLHQTNLKSVPKPSSKMKAKYSISGEILRQHKQSDSQINNCSEIRF